jgi:hypothetical protein
MGDRRRQRPGAGRAGTGRPARPAGKQNPAAKQTPGAKQSPAKPEPQGNRSLRALNPRRTPTRSRTRTAALAFAALAVVLGILGFTVDRSYLPPAVLLVLLALLWGLRALTMR